MTELGFVAAALLLVQPVTLTAQARVDSTSYPPRHVYRHSLTIASEYDASEDKTVLQTAPFALDPSMSLSVLTTLDGRVVTKPATSIVFTFWSTAPAGRYAANHSVRVVLNGRDTLSLGNAGLVPTHDPRYSEVLLKGSFLGQFLAIANADAVTFLVGAGRFPLSAADVQGLHDFASRMAPLHR